MCDTTHRKDDAASDEESGKDGDKSPYYLELHKFSKVSSTAVLYT